MKKFLLFFKISFQEILVYRVELAFGFLLKLVIFLAFVFIWKQIYSEGKDIEGYSINGIILYYLLTQTIDSVYSSRGAKLIREDILKGTLSTKLIKPFNKIIYFFSYHTARVSVESLIHISLTIPIFMSISSILEYISLDLMRLLFFIISLVLAMIFSFNLFFSVGLCSFWTKQSHGLQMIIKNASRIFTGDLIPLDLLPFGFRRIVMYTPFAYILYFPISILMGFVSTREILKGFQIIFFWIIIFTLLNFFLWKKGLKKYEAVGI